jgi:hypothetical protein
MRVATSILLLVTALPFCVRAENVERDTSKDVVNGETIRAATKLLIENHLRQDIDQRKLSMAWAKRYMLALDPYRMHFLASDADEFLKQSTSLVANAQDGDVQFPMNVMKRFRERLEANAMLIAKLLAAKHDYSADESVQTEHLKYAANKTANNERWRLRIKYELLMEKMNASDDKSSREFLRARYSRILKHFRSISSSKTVSVYIHTLARSFDSNSGFIDDEVLMMFRTSHFPNYRVGVKVGFRKGHLWILPTRDVAKGQVHLGGHRIVAVRLGEQDAIHISGLTAGPAFRTLISPFGKLGDAKTIILELDDPKRASRMTVACDRWRPGR